MNPSVTKFTFFALILLQIQFSVFSQISQEDTLKFSALNKSKLEFLLDDTYLFGGVLTSGIYYSNNFRALQYGNGFVFGIEQYFPTSGKVFFSAGMNVTQRNFSYLLSAPNIQVRNTYLDVPLGAAFELPILRSLDFRIILGSNTGVRLHSVVRGDYNALLEENPEMFVYDVNDFHRFDFGWIFGLSAEYQNILLRFRSYSGFGKLDRKDQGMLNSFNFEVGYFLFRGLNRKK